MRKKKILRKKKTKMTKQKEKIYCIDGQSFTCAPNTTSDCTEKKGTIEGTADVITKATKKSNRTLYFLSAGIVILLIIISVVIGKIF